MTELLVLVFVLGSFSFSPSGSQFGEFACLYEYERGVVFTLGKYTGMRGPGITVVIPVFQTMQKVDMRIKTAEIPRQEVMTRDNIPMLVNAVVYFKVIKPEDAIIKIEDYAFAIRQYTQAALRDVIGNSEMDFVLTERESIAQDIKEIVDAETDGWGIDVESIKIQEVELPAEMKRAMAQQAEAERERRAVVINSMGELEASSNLQKAAQALSESPRSDAFTDAADHPCHCGRSIREDCVVYPLQL